VDSVLQLSQNLFRCWSKSGAGRRTCIGVNEAAWEIRRGVAADDRMLDLLKPLARPKLFTFNELPHGVRGQREMTALRLLQIPRR
jgi:hypothetical protein